MKTLTPEVKELMAFRKELMSLQGADRFIARSDYAKLRDTYSSTYTFFENALRNRDAQIFLLEHLEEISRSE